VIIWFGPDELKRDDWLSDTLTTVKYFVVFVWPPIVASDYLSLFFVKKALEVARSANLRKAIWLATAVGVIAITAVSLIEWRISKIIFGFLEMFGSTPLWREVLGAIEMASPAFLVHLWLPLFLIGAGMSSGARMFFHAVGATQWFLERGKEHPFDAIGIMASILVFVAVALIQGMRMIL
jgi:hypothetical protein